MSDKAQTIYRVIKNKDFVILDKTVLLDSRLSWKAKGIHSYMMAQKDDWIFHRDVMLQFCKDGKDSLHAGLKELQKYGYVVISCEKENGLITQWITTVYERPQACEQPCVQPVNSTNGKSEPGTNQQKPVNSRAVAESSRFGFSRSGKPAANNINPNNNKNNNNLGRQLSVDNSGQLPTESLPFAKQIFKKTKSESRKMTDQQEQTRRKVLEQQLEQLTKKMQVS